MFKIEKDKNIKINTIKKKCSCNEKKFPMLAARQLADELAAERFDAELAAEVASILCYVFTLI